MVTRLSSVRSNLPIFACWVVNNVDCTWADFCRGTGRSLCWTCDSSGRVSGLVHAQGSTSSSPEPGGPGEATSSAPSMTAEGGGHLCVALQLLLASRLVYLFQPRAGTDVRSNIRVREYCTGLQYHEWMCGSACKPTDLFLSHPGIKRPPNGGSRSQDEPNGWWHLFRQQAVADMDSRVDKKNMYRRDPLMATKQTNHSRLRKMSWAGNGTRMYHMCLPCFFSSLDTYGYYWRQDIGQDGPVLWTSNTVPTIQEESL